MVTELLLTHIIDSLIDAHLLIKRMPSHAPSKYILMSQRWTDSIIKFAYLLRLHRLSIHEGEHMCEHFWITDNSGSCRQLPLRFFLHYLAGELCVKLFDLLLLILLCMVLPFYGPVGLLSPTLPRLIRLLLRVLFLFVWWYWSFALLLLLILLLCSSINHFWCYYSIVFALLTFMFI